MKHDCIVIGGGVIGCAILDRLAQYNISALLLERSDDVAVGASRANSGIVHAGYDCEPNTLKAKFNVLGNKMMKQECEELDVPFVQSHSLVVGSKDQYDKIKELFDKGVQNGVDVEILDKAKTLEVEPNVSDEIEWSLFAKDAGIVSPYKLTIAYADRAVTNGAQILTEQQVVDVKKVGDEFVIKTIDNEYKANIVINSAGAVASKINDMVGAEHYETEFRRGDYFVLDQTESSRINTVIFPLPTAAGKGILVAPTADGNVIYGPTSINTKMGDTAVTLEGLDQIRSQVEKSYKMPNYRKVIRLYAGVRAGIGHDFVIGESAKVKNFVVTAGICSPGLSSAPSIADEVANIVAGLMPLQKKDDIVKTMPRHKKLKQLEAEELKALTKENSAWGRIVCRCEKVTEAEIVNAIHSPLKATTVDAIKRRTRAGMGRCQGGFCATRVMQILSRELNIPMEKVKKGGANSEIAVCEIKEVQK